MTEGFAQYSFLVQVSTDDHDIVNNFGYRIEEKFQESIRKRIMVGLSDCPHLINIAISPLSVDMLENMDEDAEEEDEE